MEIETAVLSNLSNACVRLIYSSKSMYACSKHHNSVKTVSLLVTSSTYPANFHNPLLHLRTSSLPRIRLLGMALVLELPSVSVGAAVALVAPSLGVWMLAGVVVMLVRSGEGDLWVLGLRGGENQGREDREKEEFGLHDENEEEVSFLENCSR